MPMPGGRMPGGPGMGMPIGGLGAPGPGMAGGNPPGAQMPINSCATLQCTEPCGDIDSMMVKNAASWS